MVRIYKEKTEEVVRMVDHKYTPFPHWYLHNIAVKKEHQGQGFTGKLLKQTPGSLKQ